MTHRRALRKGQTRAGVLEQTLQHRLEKELEREKLKAETLKAVATILEREEEAGLRDKGDTPESVQGH